MITEQQRLERIGYIGSSDAAAILGLSRWKTPLQVWGEKSGNLPLDNAGNELAKELGNELEDVCARLFERRTGKKVQRMNQTVFHPKHSFIAANIDRRVVGEDALLEIKTAGAWAAKGWKGEEIPQEVICQVMHQLLVTGKSYGYACCLIGGNQDFKWQRIDRDEPIIQKMLSREIEFWEKYVVPKVMPMQITADDGETLYSLFPSGQGEESEAIELGDDADRLIESIKSQQQDAAVLSDQIEKSKNELKAMLKDKTYGVTPRYRVAWKNFHKAAYTVKESNGRQLRITKAKGE